MSPNQPASGGQTSEPSPTAKVSTKKEPDVVQAGQWMLIFALVLIFLVCCAVSVHLYLRRQKRRRRKKAKNVKKDEKKDDPVGAELASKEKSVAELTGTPICEMGDSEPCYEMEDAEVHEWQYATDESPLTNPANHPVVTPMQRDLEAGTYFGEMNSEVSPLHAEARIHAAYWSRAM